MAQSFLIALRRLSMQLWGASAMDQLIDLNT